MIPEDLVTLVQELAPPGPLREWFGSLTALTNGDRASALRIDTQRLLTSGADPQLVSAIRMLENPQVFVAVQKAVAELDR